MNELKNYIDQIVRPVWAFQFRKARMRQEMLAHLLAIYEEELVQCGDRRAAVDAARRRFGDVNELAEQLQNSVPLIERAILICLDRKEQAMWRALCLIGVFLFFVGPALILPAMARLKQDQSLVWQAGVVVPTTLGVLITLAGVGAVIYSIKMRKTRPS